jgi:hypothetical protein
MDDFGWLGKSFYCIHVWQQAGLGGAMRHVENSARPTQLLRQNPDVQPTGRPNHSFKTILTHLIHPMDDFGWLGKSFYCIHVWQQAGLGCAMRHVENSARPQPNF